MLKLWKLDKQLRVGHEMTHSGESRELGFPMTSRDIPGIFSIWIGEKMVNTHTSVLEGIEKNGVNFETYIKAEIRVKSRCSLLIYS